MIPKPGPWIVAGLLALSGAAAAEPPSASPPLAAEPLFTALSVDDADASAAWYGKVFGFEVVREVDLDEREIKIRLLRGPAGFLELVEQGSARSLSEVAPDLGRRHQLHGVFKTGFLVPDLDAAMERLTALGVSVRGQVVTEADGSYRSVQIVDPDDNVLQLFEALEPAPTDPATD